MRVSTLSIAVAVAALAAQATSPATAGMADSAADSRRLNLNVTNVGDRNAARPAITVAGRDGKYDRVETFNFRAALTLSAQTANAGAYKIVRSRLFLKTDGTATTSEGVDTLDGALPSAVMMADRSYEMPIALNGPVAQNAIALCNSIPAAERSGSADLRRAMSVAVAWRVTSGRFAFKWTNYDRVAPSDEILRNADFYADQETQEAETLIDADVACAPLLGAAIAGTPTAENPVRRVALTSTPVAQASARDVASMQRLSQGNGGAPVCEGGMVRQISTASENSLCLCPGNTTRIEKGDNAFSCERRARR